MAKGDMKRQAAAQRAQALYSRLMQLRRPADLSNNEWAAKAGVNTSFFTNLKKGSEPSIGNLRAVLEVTGISLPEFFVHEAQGRLGIVPDEQSLAAVILAALPDMPKRPDRRAQYLAEVVLHALELPADLRPTATISASHAGEILPSSPEARAATKKA